MHANPVKRILVVDDESMILSLMKQLLVAEGYEVVTANDGEEAIHLAEETWFDLFLIDLIMPRKEGIETILSLRTHRKSAPIIAMSGGWLGGTVSCLPLAEKVGACATLAKPFDRETLLGTVRSVLSMREVMDPDDPGPPGPSARSRGENNRSSHAACAEEASC